MTVVADHVAEPHRFAANSLLGSTEAVTVTLVGPALGGVLVATAGGPVALGVDAVSFIALLWAALALPNAHHPERSAPQPVRLRSVLRRPLIAWLLALTIVFYGLYGPFETALPVYVHNALHAGAALYGAMWASFGGGALIGSFLAGTRPIKRVEAFAVVVVAGWGVCVIVVGAISIPAVVAAAMAVGGLVYAPYPAITTTTLQQLLPAGELAAGAAGWFALLTVITPATTAAGGPLVATIGARSAIVASGAATVGLAVLVTAIHQRSQQRHRRTPTSRPST